MTTARLRDDLAERELHIPAQDARDTRRTFSLGKDDLKGADYICHRNGRHGLDTILQLRDNRVVFVSSIDLDYA